MTHLLDAPIITVKFHKIQFSCFEVDIYMTLNCDLDLEVGIQNIARDTHS